MASQKVFDAAKTQILMDYAANYGPNSANLRSFVPGGWWSLTEYLNQLAVAGGPDNALSDEQRTELVVLLAREHYTSLRSTLPVDERLVLDGAMTAAVATSMLTATASALLSQDAVQRDCQR